MKKSAKVWAPESEEQLRGYFECTEWSVLVDSCENVSEAADVVSSSLLFKGCDLDATAGLVVTTAGLGHSWTREPHTLCTLPKFTQPSHKLSLYMS